MKRSLFVLLILTAIFASCKKEKKDISLPKLTTTAISGLTYNSATSGGNITGDGGAAITASGICWSKTNNTPTVADSKTTGSTASGSFTSVMNGLEENTTYYVRAYATNSKGTGYGNTITFTTPVNVKVPELTTAAITDLAYNKAKSGGTITTNGGAAITASGVCWSKSNNNPTTADLKTAENATTGTFTSLMENLEENTTYYVRAYAINSAGTGYGNTITFTTPVNVQLPELTTAAITNLAYNTATSGGTITSNGGANITASGVCWSKTNNTPTIDDDKTSGTTASGSFSSVMNNLEENTTYYVRAYAANSAGTGYGNTITFTTPVNITLPVLTTAAITNLAYNTATSGGTITSNGGGTITVSGICWSKTNNNPTTADSKTSGATASGSFVAVMNSLEENTTYYVRAYATNSAGTGYGNTITFTTPVNITIPVLSTTAITNLGPNTATSGGTITSNGGGTISVSGICWSKTNNNPTTADSKTSGTTASGSFVAVMNNLDPSTTYYVRAYATNSSGTGYGNAISFTTSAADENQVTFVYNGATVTYGVITSPTTGRKWLDRNLGASQVATAFNDYRAYGHLFQWGRPADGHQLINYSNGTSGSPVNGKTKTLATSDAPGHSTFITPDNTIAQGGVFIYDWRNDQNTNRWAINAQGACPTGWHIPTAAEWAAETGITNLSTAFSQLKLTAPGYRYGDFDGSNRDGTVRSVGSFAYYWSSSVWPSGAGFSSYKDISSNDSYSDLLGRAYGCAIRCIKNQ